MLREDVIFWLDAVQMIDVDIIGADKLQALFEALNDFTFRIGMILRRQRYLGRDHQAIARSARDRFANDRLGAVALRGVEKVNAEIERLFDQRDGIVSRLRIAAEPEPACPAAAEAGNAHFQSSPSESCVFHIWPVPTVSIVPVVLFVRLATTKSGWNVWNHLNDWNFPFLTPTVPAHRALPPSHAPLHLHSVCN